jgi:hypothetical protein
MFGLTSYFSSALGFGSSPAASLDRDQDKDVHKMAGSLAKLSLDETPAKKPAPKVIIVRDYSKLPDPILGIIARFACEDEQSYLAFTQTCKNFKQATLGLEANGQVFKGNDDLVSAYLTKWGSKRWKNDFGIRGGPSIPKKEPLRFIDAHAPTIRSFSYDRRYNPRGREFLDELALKLTQFHNLEAISCSGSFDPSILGILKGYGPWELRPDRHLLRELNIHSWWDQNRGGASLQLDQIAADPLSKETHAVSASLQTLRVASCELLHENTPAQLAKLTNLTVLDLAGSKIKGADSAGDAVAVVLPQLQKLQALNLSGSKLTNAGLAHITHLVSLTLLDVSNCTGLTDEGVCSLSVKLPLAAIDLSGTKVSNRSIVHLGAMKLRKLELAFCPNIKPGFLNDLQHIECLRVLDLADTTEDDTILRGIESAVNLQHLNISSAKKITGSCLQDVAKLGRLSSLNIRSNTQINEKALLALAKMKNLTFLDLTGLQQVTDLSVEVARSLPRLQTLLLHSTSITDIGLDAISEMPQLHTLSLFLCSKITNTGLLKLAQAHLLTSLDVRCAGSSIKEPYGFGEVIRSVTEAGQKRLLDERANKFMPQLTFVQG